MNPLRPSRRSLIGGFNKCLDNLYFEKGKKGHVEKACVSS